MIIVIKKILKLSKEIIKEAIIGTIGLNNRSNGKWKESVTIIRKKYLRKLMVFNIFIFRINFMN